MSDEPELQPNDLEERLKTTIKRAEVALLLIRYGFPNFLPAVLEDLFYGCQTIIDLYCVKDQEYGTFDYLERKVESEAS